MHKMEIGITGSTGVLGGILKNKLQKKNYTVDCFTGDITEKTDVFHWLAEKKYTTILHLAALVPVNEVNSNPAKAYSINVGGTIHLLEALQILNIKPWLFYASTSHVYKSSEKSLKEDDQIEPINTYGLTKYISEQILVDYFSHGHIELCVGRIFSFYHKTQKGSFLYPTILKRLQTENLDQEFNLIGANSVRDLTNAEIICDLIISLVEKKINGIYNIGSGKGTRIQDFVQSLTPFQLQFKIEQNETVNYLVADISKLNSSLQIG